MKIESAKQTAEESPSKATIKTNIFRKANGWMLIKTILWLL